MRYTEIMEIRIKTTDYEMAPAVSTYLDQKLSAIEKLLGGDALSARCEVELGKDGHGRHGDHEWVAEITLTYPGGATIRASNREANVNAAIDAVKAEVERQIRKQRSADRGFVRRSGAALKRMMRFGA